MFSTYINTKFSLKFMIIGWILKIKPEKLWLTETVSINPEVNWLFFFFCLQIKLIRNEQGIFKMTASAFYKESSLLSFPAHILGPWPTEPSAFQRALLGCIRLAKAGNGLMYFARWAFCSHFSPLFFRYRIALLLSRVWGAGFLTHLGVAIWLDLSNNM